MINIGMFRGTSRVYITPSRIQLTPKSCCRPGRKEQIFLGVNSSSDFDIYYIILDS